MHQNGFDDFSRISVTKLFMVTGTFTFFGAFGSNFWATVSMYPKFDILCSAHYVSLKNKSLICERD